MAIRPTDNRKLKATSLPVFTSTSVEYVCFFYVLTYVLPKVNAGFRFAPTTHEHILLDSLASQKSPRILDAALRKQ